MTYQGAIEDFHAARRRASLQQLMSRLTGQSDELLSYESVREQLGVTAQSDLGLHDIPVGKIVGSVGRYKDFTRTFMPKHDATGERWARVKTAVTDSTGVPPIDVYKIGDAYFVLDGNHRVSVARALESPTISAFVKEVKTRVPLSAEDTPDDVIVKARYANFLDDTKLDKARPNANLQMTFAGQYRLLKEHIEIHRYFMGKSSGRAEISLQEAAVHWYDTIYLPIVQRMRDLGVMRNFPKRTEADLYVLVSEHRAVLESSLGEWWLDTETAVANFAKLSGETAAQTVSRVGGQLLEAVTPDELEDGPTVGAWRRERGIERQKDRLFSAILVAGRGAEDEFSMLQQAMLVAQRENGRLLGLHVVPADAELSEDEPARLGQFFEKTIADNGVQGAHSVVRGNPARLIAERAAWVDLVVVSLRYPPGNTPFKRFNSGFHTLVQRISRPLLAVPVGSTSDLSRVLLAYDGSPKSDEALFVATYMTLRWGCELVVLTAVRGRTSADALPKAKKYLTEQGAEATFVEISGQIGAGILQTAEQYKSNLLVMGGYGNRAVRQLLTGSTVDEMLREFKRPILICR